MPGLPAVGTKPHHKLLRRIEVLFFLLGLSALVYFIHRYGTRDLLAHIASTGWTFVLIVVLWFLIYLLNTSAWWIVLGPKNVTVPFHRLFRLTVSGFALNDITPLIALGGEPYKMSVLSETMGRGRSVSAVTLYRMVYSLAHLLILLAGVILTLFFVRVPAPLREALILVGIVLLAVISILIVGHRQGFFTSVFNALQHWAILRRVFERFSVRPESVQRMDELITSAYHERRGSLYTAVGLEFVARCCMGLEIFLILKSIGLDMDLTQTFFLYISYSILVNILFIVPYNIGVREGGFYFALQSLALPPMLGVYLAIVMRVREFFWVLLGLFFIGVGNLRKAKPTT